MCLALQIYAHLIFMAGKKKTLANQTVLYILWKSIFYARRSSSFQAAKEKQNLLTRIEYRAFAVASVLLLPRLMG